MTEERHRQTLVEECKSILEECRMVLPGIQALVGFQFVVVFQAGFRERLTYVERCAHLAAMGMVVIATVLAMAPAAYQRQAEPHEVTRGFVTLASRFVALGMAALTVGLSVDLYLLARVVTESAIAAGVVAGLAATFAVGLWFVLPLGKRRRRA